MIRSSRESVSAALAAGRRPTKCCYRPVSPLCKVGRLFEQGEAYIPEMLIAARAMQAAVELLAPIWPAPT